MKRLLGAIATLIAIVGAGAMFGFGVKCGEETGDKVFHILKEKYSKKEES